MKTIFSKIFSGYFTVAVLLSLFIVVFSSEAIKKNYINYMSKNLEVVSELLESRIITYIENNELKSLRKYVKNIGEKTSNRITVIDMRGNVIADSDEDPERMQNHADRPEIKQALLNMSGSSIRYSETVKKEMLYFARIISGEKGKWILRNSLYLEHVDQLITVIVAKILIIGLVFLLVALGVSFYISKRISDPVKKLSSAARDIAEEKFELPVEIDSNDEIKELADSFNHMADEINKLLNVKKELVANVSHELKTPLAAIKGFAETLAEEEKDKGRLHYIDVISRNTERLINIVNDLLVLSKLESVQETAEKDDIRINELFDNAVKVFHREIEEKEIAIVNEINPDVSVINGDAFKIEQVIINIFGNAVRYTDKGSITIRTFREGEYAVIEIEDTGIGIPKNEIDRVFDRFYVTDRSRSRKSGGTGLGLSIVKHIITMHKGSISIASKPSAGTKVSVKLPF